MNKILVKDKDLYSQSTKENPAGGVLYRVGRRIKKKQKEKGEFTDREKRNLLIGEVGEFAVALDYKNRGFNIDFISWDEFKFFEIDEGTVDLITTKNGLCEKIQVKSSEYGNRAIRTKKLNHYEKTRIDKIIFVAVRELSDKDKNSYFECEITSRISPRQMRMSKNWFNKFDYYYHNENKTFIEKWKKDSKYLGSKKILTHDFMWIN